MCPCEMDICIEQSNPSFIYRTLYAIDRYLHVLSLKMSEELILEWTIFIGIYVFLLVLFFFNIYLCLSFLILYVILRIIQSRYKKLLPVKSKAVLVTGCDRGKSIYVHVEALLSNDFMKSKM